MLKRITIKVKGRVQGVFFRQNTKEIAQELNLSGSVENSSDGSVLIIAEGEEKDLIKLLNWTKIGSNYAIVKKIESTFSEATGEFQIFQVQ